MQSLYNGCINRKGVIIAGDLSFWNTSKVTNLSNMFNYQVTSTSTPVRAPVQSIKKWNVSNVTNISKFCYEVHDNTKFELPYWNTSMIENIQDACRRMINLETLDISYWNTSKVTNTDGFLASCSKQGSLFYKRLD